MLSGEWWRNAVVYQIYVRSFADGNGDGIGDLAGIVSRLDHLVDLGVDAIWLTPCYPSPQADHGYDVADYFDIEPDYGTLATFDALVAEAHRRGIRVLMDIVANHCSDHHDWFRAALAAPPGSDERDRFWFRDGRGTTGEEPPNNWAAWFGGRAWTRVAEANGEPGQWYLHLFTPEQPDWNWHNGDVAEMFDRALEFWFDRGVDGFRVDAAIVLGKAPGLPDAPPLPESVRATDAAGRNPHTLHRPEGHQVFKHWRAVADGYEQTHPGRSLVFVAEAYSPDPQTLLRYVEPDELHQAFVFDLMLARWRADDWARLIRHNIEVLAGAGASLTWTLNNHDTQRIVTRLGRADATVTASANNLIGSDAPVDIELGERRSRAAALILLALPGAIYLYQGEELGLPEVLDLPDAAREDPVFQRTNGQELGRDGCRVPLPWTEQPAHNFGFSTTDAPAWLPMPDGFGGQSVQAESARPDSTLALYRRAIAYRRASAALRLGPWTGLVTGHRDLLAFDRGDIRIVANFGDDALDIAALTAGRTVAVASAEGASAQRLSGNSALWLR